MREVLINVAVAVAAFVLGRWSLWNEIKDEWEFVEDPEGWEGTDNE